MVGLDASEPKRVVPEPFLQLHSKSDKEDESLGCDSHLYLSWEGELHTTYGSWSSEVRLGWLCKNRKQILDPKSFIRSKLSFEVSLWKQFKLQLCFHNM